jgi:thiamine-phosphate pyrophosphorylase
MNWKKKCLKEFKLYAITDLKSEDPDIVGKVELALQGGVDIVQLRSKGVSDRFLIEIGCKILKLTRRMKRLFIVNDRIDLMQVIDADGVHLGQDDVPIEVARKLIKDPAKIIGVSTHSLGQASVAQRKGADYIGFGPIFATPTKPAYPAVGLAQIRNVMKKISIPVVCIGGIDRINLSSVMFVGAKRVAVVRAIFGCDNPFEAAKVLKEQLAQ